MFEFKNTPQGEQKPVVESAAEFNFDSSDFSMLVQESDTNIADTMDQYRALMTETLTESAGVINEDAEIIMEQANEHIGQRIVKILQAIKNWIVKTAKNIIVRIQDLAISNKKFVEKVKPAVREKMNKGELKGLKAELYQYDLGIINVSKIKGAWSQLYKTSAYDLSSEYTQANRQKLDESVKKVSSASRDEIAASVLKIVYGGSAKTMKEVGVEARKLLRKDGKRKVVDFSTSYVDIVEKFGDTKKPIEEAFKEMEKQVDDMIAAIKKNIKEVPKAASKEEKEFNSGLIAYYNAKRKILSNSLDIAVFLNNLKLQAAVEQMREARRFCVQAFHYKPKQLKESDVVEPYAPHLDLSETADQLDDSNSPEEVDNKPPVEESAIDW